MSAKNSFVIVVLLILIIEVIPIEIDLQEGEELKGNNLESSQLNECLSVRRSNEVGVCFGKELLNKLNNFDEADTFSLATGVSFVRDEKTPRDIGSFLDKDPMDFRSIIEDASHLISKRSLHWDLSGLYPGLVMRIGPTLANGVLEFVMDPRIKDRTYQQHPNEISTGRLLARNLLVPFLLGFKFQLSTLLPLVLGLLLIASKKAFLLAKLALLAVTVFSSGFGSQGSYFGGGPSLSSYTSAYEPATHYHDHHDHHGSGYYRRQPPPEYYYKEKSAEPSTASPITPEELRDRLERLFVTKKDAITDPREEIGMRNARNFQWTPISTG
ncbi:osiris 10a [Anticarsia gemmatalis]|uniref:osiris 10a n=1 Tax=Anticarsia gemmatalis TaxID=129554 RepID=UPI003F76555E